MKAVGCSCAVIIAITIITAVITAVITVIVRALGVMGTRDHGKHHNNEWREVT